MFKRKPKPVEQPPVQAEEELKIVPIEEKIEPPVELPPIVEPKKEEKKQFTPVGVPNQIRREPEIVLKPLTEALLVQSIRRNFIWVVVMVSLAYFCLLATALFHTAFIYPSMICMLFAVLFSIQHSTATIRKEIRDNE